MEQSLRMTGGIILDMLKVVKLKLQYQSVPDRTNEEIVFLVFGFRRYKHLQPSPTHPPAALYLVLAECCLVFGRGQEVG